MSYATFGNFSQAVSLDTSWNGPCALYFTDCVFKRNGAAMEGSYWGTTVEFLQTEFSSNLRPVSGYGGYMRFDGCYFHSQDRGAALYALSLVMDSCVFVNHTGVALWIQSDGSTIRDSLFVSNDVGVQTKSAIENCIFLMNRVGIAAADGARIEGGWICGRPLENSSDLIQWSSLTSMQVSHVWFGIPGQYEAIIRGSIKDGYWWPLSGFVDLIQVSDRPTAWPKSLQSFNTSYASQCSAPRDRGFDLQHPPSGVIVGRVTWSGSGTVTEINTSLVLSAGSVLTIEAGAVLRFTSPSAVLVIKGTIIARGRPDARIVFDGVDMTSRALYIPNIGGVNVNMSYATFGNFSQAVSLDTSWNGPCALYFTDCVFKRNGAAMEGSYWGTTVEFLQTEFSSNLRPVSGYGGYMRFDGCYFHSQDRGAALYALSLVMDSCVFVNHTGVALWIQSDGSTIRDSLFVSNDVGVQTKSAIENCIFLMNRVGIAAADGARIEGGWICGRPLENSSDLIQWSSLTSMQVSHVWFGIPGQYEAIIRGSIKDGYWWPLSGFVDLIQVSDRPTAWPKSLQSFNTSYASQCSAPRDRGFNLYRFSGVGLNWCQPGSYSAVSGSSTCIACSPGTFSNSTGASACETCIAGTYSPTTGTVSVCISSLSRRRRGL